MQALLLAQAVEHPVCLIVEDLHWADPSTLEFLDRFMDQVPISSVMTVLTCRPSFESPWDTRTQVTSLVLNRLTRPQIEDMVVQVARGKFLPVEVMQHLVDKTDGVPLFVEELTRMLLESGQLLEQAEGYEMSTPLSPPEIPATLYDALMARLDRLGTAKEVAQWCAVLGREFTYEVLASIVPFDESTLQRGMSHLVAAELVFQRGLLSQVHYWFKHMLVRDAAYESILKRRRQELHHRIAEVLAARFPELLEKQPGLWWRTITRRQDAMRPPSSTGNEPVSAL